MMKVLWTTYKNKDKIREPPLYWEQQSAYVSSKKYNYTK
jgi:hypothetical protein